MHRRALSRKVSAAGNGAAASAPAPLHWSLSTAASLPRSAGATGGMVNRARSAVITRADLLQGRRGTGMMDPAAAASALTQEWLAAPKAEPAAAAAALTTDSQRAFSRMLLQNERYTLLRNLCKCAAVVHAMSMHSTWRSRALRFGQGQHGAVF